ncbi:MAG: carbohydrate ABC transporter permease [Pleomorphochaeta sp.]
MKLKKNITPYLYLLPTMIILILFVFYPLARAIQYSFTDFNLLSPPKWIGLENYKTLFKSDSFYRALLNTLKYFIVVVPVLVILPLLIAVLVNDTKLKGVTIFRTIYYFPVVTSMVVAGIIWKWMYMEKGLLNYVLYNLLHLISEPISYLTNPNTALFCIMVVTIWKGLGYYMVLYLAGLQSINKELYEAATIDGASKFKQLRSITVPLLAPTIAVVAIMSSMAAMKVFDEIYVMTAGGPFNSTRTLVYEIYDTAFDKLKFGYASSIGVILFILLFVFSYISMKNSEKTYRGVA